MEEIKIRLEEIKKINLIEQLSKEQITIEEFCEILKLSKRQIYRIKKKYEKGKPNAEGKAQPYPRQRWDPNKNPKARVPLF